MNTLSLRGLSLTARLALLFAAMASGLLVVVGIAVDRAVSAHFDELDQHDLAAKLAAIETLLATTVSDDALVALQGRLDDALAGHDTVALRVSIPARGWRHAILDERFANRFDNGVDQRFDPRVDTGSHPHSSAPQALMKWRDAHGTPFIGKAATIIVHLPEPVAAEVVLGLDIAHHVRFLQTMRVQLGIGISAATLLAAMLGWLAARKGLAPIRRVTATAGRLSAERLGERLSEQEAPAEMRELVEAFNGMLERLEASFRQLSDFSADIAHELRTPVSNLMTETQVALSRSRSAEQYHEVLHSNLEEFDRLARMIADMLFLAKADNGLLPRPAERVALEDEAAALLEFYEALAEEKAIRLSVSGQAEVTGDRLMLRRALSNLLSNAIRHTPASGFVDVAIQQNQDAVSITVTNPGETIPPEQLPLLFERFHRVDASRTRQGEGAGLGLAITQSIVKAHGGTITATSVEGLTRFTIRLGS
ncbi:heavy metal sensor histidine kinase [Rhodocyclaceae bacterium SMB388]